jgi:hypothetical protein
MAQNPAVHMVVDPPLSPQAGQAYLTWPGLELYAGITGADGAVALVPVPRLPYKQEFQLSLYVNLVLMLMLAIAIAFQMPLVIALLGWMGLATPQWFRRHRRYALLICGVVAVIITPPDAFSALLMMLPLYALYELGILLLVAAPASAVAEGRVFSLRRFRESPADNRREPMDQPRKPAHVELTVSRRNGPAQSAHQNDDRGEGGS